MKTKKADFMAYEKVRLSGVTNMFDIRTVENLSGLHKDQIKDIMGNYGKYSSQWKEVSK